MNKKGQAAMEFLMTYGWAILVVLAAIGALAYFGVLSPGKLLPERTIFKAPLSSIDNALVTDNGDGTVTLEIPFINGKGNSINISDGTWTSSDTDDCTGTTVSHTSQLNGAAIPANGVVISNGEKFIFAFTCPTAKTAGEKLKADIQFDYNDLTTGQTRPHSGTVDAQVLA